MKIVAALLGAALANTIFGCGANATTLNGVLTVDDTFSAYISTSDAVLGTLILTDPDSNWATSASFSGVALTPGVTNYLHVVGRDVFGVISAFMGQFSLSDTGFKFANGTQSLLTDTTHWTVNQSGGAPWFAPSGTPVSFGSNGVGPWGSLGSINASAQWIWSGNELGTAFFSTTITPTTETPLPGAIPLFATGLGVMAWLARRRKSKNAVANAAAA